MKPRAMLILGFFLVAAAIWLSPLVACPTCVPFQPGALYSDLLVSHWPNASFLRRALREWGELPLWNPTILSGAPFAADPLAGLWYPPNWLLLVLPLSFGFNLLLWLHLAWAGWGAFRLLRAEGAGMLGSAIAGLAFGGLPKLVGHAGLGHVSLVMAVSWTPWVLLALRNAVEELRLRDAALAGACLGLVFLIDPRWALPALLLALTYGIRLVAHSHREQELRWGRVGAGAGVMGLFAAGTAAVLALPMWEFTRLSTRATLSASEQAVLSLPAGHLFGIVLPDVGGYAEWLTYVGAAVLLLAIVAIITARPGYGFWTGTALVALLLAQGDQTPLYGLLSAIPGFNLLRVPPRWLFVFGLAMSLVAGWGFDALVGQDLPAKITRRMRLTLVATGAFFLLLCSGVVMIGVREGVVGWQTWALSTGIGVIAAVWGLICLGRHIKPRMVAAGCMLLVVIDLGLMNASLLEPKSLEDVTERPGFMDDGNWQQGRIFSPSYSVPQHIAAAEGLELADGVNPLQLATYRDFMASATGFSTDAYSVTLPPFPSGDPGDDWGPEINAQQLGLLNVSWVVSAYPLEAEGLALEQVIDDLHVYHNDDVRSRAWVESEEQAADPSWVAAEILEWTPSRVIVTASGPGRLVLSEIDYPGWTAEVDGERVEIETAYDVLRSVVLPPGEHEVVFCFHGWMVGIGAALTLLTLLALAVLRWRR